MAGSILNQFKKILINEKNTIINRYQSNFYKMRAFRKSNIK